MQIILKGKEMFERADLQNLIKRVFVLLTGIQILLGLVWLTGRVVEVPLAVCTVFFAWKAYAYFLRLVMEWFGKETKLWSIRLWAAYLVTFPVILHCHVANLSYSLGSTFLTFLLTDFICLRKKESNVNLCLLRIAGEWFGVSVFVPTYGVITAIVVLPILMLYGWRKQVRRMLVLLAMLLAVSGMTIGDYVNQQKEEKQCIQSSMSSVLLSRFVWPYFMRNSFFWEEEVRELFSDTELVQISTYPELVRYEFGPRLEGIVGKARAREIYRKMVWDSLKIGKKDAVMEWSRDLLANATGPWAVQYQLNGGGVSYTGKNYANMCVKMPSFTGYYVRFAFYSFDFMALFALAISIFKMCKKKLDIQWDKVACILGTSCIMIFWYTMIGNGMQDYLKVIPISIFWCMLPVLGYRMLNSDEVSTISSEKE